MIVLTRGAMLLASSEARGVAERSIMHSTELFDPVVPRLRNPELSKSLSFSRFWFPKDFHHVSKVKV